MAPKVAPNLIFYLQIAISFVAIAPSASLACSQGMTPANTICSFAQEGELLVRAEVLENQFPEIAGGGSRVHVLDVLHNEESTFSLPDEVLLDVRGATIYTNTNGVAVGDVFLLMFTEEELYFAVEEEDNTVFRQLEPVETEVYVQAIFEPNRNCRATLVANGAREPSNGGLCCSHASPIGGFPFALLFLALFARLLRPNRTRAAQMF